MKSIQELNQPAAEAKQQLGIREADTWRYRINIAMGDCGIEKGARGIVHTAMEELERLDLHDVAVVQTDCMGMCNYEPTRPLYISYAVFCLKKKTQYILTTIFYIM